MTFLVASVSGMLVMVVVVMVVVSACGVMVLIGLNMLEGLVTGSHSSPVSLLRHRVWLRSWTVDGKRPKELDWSKAILLFRFLGGLCCSYIGLAANCRDLLDKNVYRR